MLIFEKAEFIGKQANKAGLNRIPLLDPQLQDLIKQSKNVDHNLIYKHWLSGWDKQNLSKTFKWDE